MTNGGSPQSNNALKIFEKRPVQWLALLAVFFGTVAAIFIMNARFSTDYLAYTDVPPAVSKNSVSQPIRVVIDFGNGKTRTFEGESRLSMRAGDALRGAAAAGKLSFSISLSGEVLAIGNMSAGNGKQWHWYLNTAPETRPIADVLVRSGDTVLLKYE